jgi:hypothetical protein
MRRIDAGDPTWEDGKEGAQNRTGNNRKIFAFSIAFFVIALLFAYCSQPKEMDYRAFIKLLDKDGFVFEEEDQPPTTPNTMSVAARYIIFDDYVVSVFEYSSSLEMEADADRIDKNGFVIGSAHISWVSYPHFFKKGKIIALYVGEDREILDFLNHHLGEQFAGLRK